MKTLAAVLLAAAALGAVGAGPESDPARVVVSGEHDPRLEPFDRLMTTFVAENRVPGAALAVARDGRVVYARGFGHADLDRAEPVRPDSLFRVASVSKPVTAAAVFRLVEAGKIRLDDPALNHLDKDLPPPADPRWRRITVRELLQHRGGFDRGRSGDPMFRSVAVAREFGSEPPAGTGLIIRSMLGRPLDLDPGERDAYSNFGYCVLGRAIENASGEPYEKAVRRLVLGPLGIGDRAMRLGRTLPEHRAPGEVTYYTPNDAAGRSVFAPEVGRRVPQPYGAWNIEAMDAHGGWLASAPALVRFASAFDVRFHPNLFNKRSLAAMFERPPGRAGQREDGRPRDAYYACGWQVRPVGRRGRNTWHTGSLPGTSTILVRRWDGLSWAVLFNTRDDPGGQFLAGKIDPLVHQAADAVKEWPDRDLFPGPKSP